VLQEIMLLFQGDHFFEQTVIGLARTLQF
jgi:hypothetical protein